MSSAMLCLALAVFYESRGEPIKGQQAVAEVVINRKESGKFPDDICAVIKQKGQFSWYNSNISLSKPPSLTYKNAPAWEQSKKVAQQAIISPTNHTNGALFFNSSRLGVRYSTETKPCRIGKHIFY